MKFSDTLITRDTKGKIRQINISCSWNDSLHAYCIERSTGLYGGKLVEQEPHLIQRGKASRTVTAQAELETQSIVKKYKDKGYRSITDFGYTSIDDFNPDEVFPKDVVDQSGVVKPMLAKKYQDVNPKLLENEWYGSRKINGVRCLMYYKDGEIHTRSRTATNYDVATSHLRNNPSLLDFFSKNPNVILDGELFKMGWPLNKISGLCRKEEFDSEQYNLEYYLYDIVLTTKPFVERLEAITDFADKLNLTFNPFKIWKEGELKIQIVPHVKMQGAENIKKYHDEYVSEGWEGLVIRNPNSVYKIGSRGNDMLKYKSYLDAEYEILGITEGLRREDFSFLMRTSSGNKFNAKPIGSREVKEAYRKNLDKMIGKMATVKYFELSGTGSDIPQQPIFIGIRYE